MERETPSKQEYRRLYEAAIALKKAAPWEWMWENEIFGVRNPETGEIGYVSIMGANGEHLALDVYLGTEALNGFWRMYEGQGQVDPFLLLELPQLQVSFEDRRLLDVKDRQIIRSLGLRFRGRQAWPLLRSYAPGCLPWFLSAAEARFLAVAIEQSLDVIRRLKKDRDLLQAPAPGQYLVRVRGKEGWHDEWLTPEPVEVRPPPVVDADRLAALRRDLPRGEMTLEADLFPLNMPIKEEQDPRPLLPYMLLVIETQTGMIVSHELLIARPDLDTVWSQAQRAMLDLITRLQAIPQQVAVRAAGRLHGLLLPIAAGLGIRLETSPQLWEIDEARASLEEWLEQ